MKLLLKSVKVFDKNSSHHLQVCDILIEEGKVKEIAPLIEAKKDFTIFHQENIGISPAWLDMNMHIFEPGLEYREDFKSGLKAAENGGYGYVAVLPNTNPPIDSNTQVDFVINSSRTSMCKTLALGAISHQIKGKDLAEIYDMHKSGAVAFTDGNKAILDAGLMERALLYVKKINGTVYSNPDNTDVSLSAQMNEGVNSTVLGLEGAPKLAEELMVNRDLYLLEHTGSSLHFVTISTKKSVDLIRKAKAKGLNVTAGVNVANLYFNDKQLLEYDTNFKVKPHLRLEEDITALLEALKDGTIDVINSGHTPLHLDEKKVEFENAEFGMSTIDCVFAAARTATKDVLSEEELIEKFTNGYDILGQDKTGVKEGEKACFSIFNLENENVFTTKDVLSKGKNNPFIGEKLIGKAIGIITPNKTNIL